MKTQLSKNIKYLRRRLNLTQEELAKEVGLNQRNIESYERGIEPSAMNLIKIAQVLNVSVNDLVTEEFIKDEPINNNWIKQWYCNKR